MLNEPHIVLAGIGDIEALLGINAALLTIVAFFLKLVVDVARRALDTIQSLLVSQAEQNTVLKSHAAAIDRHERALEKLLSED